jgi:type VII secretion integral membrane protein EccD
VGAATLIRVSVASASRRVDLALPGTLPLAELVPELARSVGILDPATAYAGYRLLTAEGRALADDAGLIIQGIEDGAVLTLVAGVDDEPPQVYDDIVEAMADVVERQLKPWQPSTGRRTALAAAGLLLCLGGAALLVEGGPVAGVAAGLMAVLLLASGVTLSRFQHEPDAALATSSLGAGFAAVGGALLAPGELHFGTPVAVEVGLPIAAGGIGAFLAGITAIIGLKTNKALVVPPVIIGAIAALAGLVMWLTSYHPAVVLSTALTLVVAFESTFPQIALGATRTKVDQLYEVADVTADPVAIDSARVTTDAQLAHQILIASSVTLGILLVFVSPLAVSLGLAGTLLAVVCCLVVVLRTRQYRAGTHVLVGLISGVAGLVSVCLALLQLQPQWRAETAVALALIGAILLAATLLPRTQSVQTGRLGDVVELITLILLLPLLVLASGLFDVIKG